ncbi:MAG TPA: Uma2 family endonuclease [Ktedonobacteraceae bacterium]|nr:Uma2 family endonuclease [Ktedonobacteraceae bacterium]
MATFERLSVVIPADWIPGPEQGSWTYSDYAALPEDGQRYEIVNGVLLMTPSPGGAHQDAVGEIFYHLRTHLKLSGLGMVRLAPFDVELSPEDVLQPDVFVVLNAHLDRVLEKKVVGAPDLVVEVASPGTAAFDRLTKSNIYAHAGVSEYWIVNTERHTVEVLVLEDGKYRSLGIFRGEQILPSRIMPDLPIGVERFFV